MHAAALPVGRHGKPGEGETFHVEHSVSDDAVIA